SAEARQGDTEPGRRLRVVFCCGAESPFGLAYLEPILTQPNLEVLGVVLATPARWSRFRHTLLGTRALSAAHPTSWWHSVRCSGSRPHQLPPRPAPLLSRRAPGLLGDRIR